MKRYDYMYHYKTIKHDAACMPKNNIKQQIDIKDKGIANKESLLAIQSFNMVNYRQRRTKTVKIKVDEGNE